MSKSNTKQFQIKVTAVRSPRKKKAIDPYQGLDGIQTLTRQILTVLKNPLVTDLKEADLFISVLSTAVEDLQFNVAKRL